jgi:hypothetical protein
MVELLVHIKCVDVIGSEVQVLVLVTCFEWGFRLPMSKSAFPDLHKSTLR